jgi:hypothetical protein
VGNFGDPASGAVEMLDFVEEGVLRIEDRAGDSH